MARIFWVLAAAGVLFLALEGLCSLLVSTGDGLVQQGIREEKHCAYDPDLGWAQLPNQEMLHLYGPGIHLHSNSQGLRGLKDHALEVPEGRYRIVCSGDSFTLGYGVGDKESYAALLEKVVPGVETLNMGLGGYGCDQAYLWYLRDGQQFETDLLLFAFVFEDLYRMEFEAFGNRYPKPVLAVENGLPVARNQPVPQQWDRGVAEVVRAAWRRTGIARMLRSQSLFGPKQAKLPFQVGDLPFREKAEALLRHLALVSEERGQDLAVAYLPAAADATGITLPIVEWLREFCAAEGIVLADLSRELAQLSPSEHKTIYLPDGHYTVLGNRRIAKALDRELDLSGRVRQKNP